MSQPLGLVVVGVGIAGRARIRDIVAQATREKPFLNNVKLIGFVSRRTLEIEGAQQIQMEDALSRDDVDAAIICTENALHESQARQFLEAGKHVLVEFPLATTATAATSLLQLAKQKGVICYEEDISLILDSHKKVVETVKEKGLKDIKYTLKGRPNGWIEKMSESGSPYVTGISMIHRIIQVCGDVTPVAATLDIRGDKSFAATATLKGKNDESISISYDRDPDNEGRRTSFEYTLSDGTVLDDESIKKLLPPVEGDARMSDPNKPGLFLQDTMDFVSMVRGERSVVESNALTLRGLTVANKLYELSQSKSEL